MKMWAYGAYYRCDEDNSTAHRTYDSGIAVDPNENSINNIDVGILSKILMVFFDTLNTVVMKIS